MPGVLGGVETPPASADGKVYVAVVNAPTTHKSPEERFSLTPQLGTHPSHLVAIDATTGHIDWQVEVPGDDLGAVTVVNDLLLTSTFGGLLLAYDRATGAEVWRHDAVTPPSTTTTTEAPTIAPNPNAPRAPRAPRVPRAPRPAPPRSGSPTYVG